jgi:hypothetical protein
MRVTQLRHLIVDPVKGEVKRTIVVAGFFEGIRKSRTPYSPILLGLTNVQMGYLSNNLAVDNLVRNQNRHRHQIDTLDKYLYAFYVANVDDLSIARI